MPSDVQNYAHVLVPLDLRKGSERVLARAVALAAAANARLTALHVVEYLPLDPVGDTIAPTPLEVTDELADAARDRLAKVCDAATTGGVSQIEQRVVVGATRHEIVRAATDLHADLIVFGNHERHGLSALFSRTEDGILHHAPCDVLAVHLPD